MTEDFAAGFASEWQEAWNAHDVERLLVHYTDDVVFQSPYVVHRYEAPTGEVRGKAALREYWATGLAQQPSLRFTVDDIRLAVDTLVINYRNQDGHGVTEVLRFRDDLVFWGCGSYVPGPSIAATRSQSQKR